MAKQKNKENKGFFKRLWNKVKENAVSYILDVVGLSVGGIVGLIVVEAVKELLSKATDGNWRMALPEDIEEYLTDSDLIIIEQWNDNIFAPFMAHISSLIDSGDTDKINTALREMAVYENALENSALKEDPTFGLTYWGLMAKYGYAYSIFSEIRNILGPGKTETFTSSQVVSQLLPILGSVELKNVDSTIQFHKVSTLSSTKTIKSNDLISKSPIKSCMNCSKDETITDINEAVIDLSSQVATIQSVEPVKVTVVTKETESGEVYQDTILNFDNQDSGTEETPVNYYTEIERDLVPVSKSTLQEEIVEETKQEEVPSDQPKKSKKWIGMLFTGLAFYGLVKLFKSK